MDKDKYKLSNTLGRSDVLAQAICEEIFAEGGRISFARFMQKALYTPHLGYYTSTKEKLGKAGDFLTAPHISPLFARTIARQFKMILQDIPQGDILEIGAGDGLFAKEILEELDRLDIYLAHYFILEISPDLRERQKRYLKQHCPHLLPRVKWLDQLPQEKINGIIFANEVLDAMPVHIFRVDKNKKITERFVTVENNHFVSVYESPSPELAEVLAHRLKENIFPELYESEISLTIPIFIKSIINILESGVILLFDYGYGCQEYYHPDRSMGTLMCYYQQQKIADPYLQVGLQDITAHVDFTNVIETAVDSGCELAGFTTQAAFLVSCGLLELAQQNKYKLSLIDQVNQMQAVKKLILPNEMGEAIKVMGLTKNFSKPLLGFSMHSREKDL